MEASVFIRQLNAITYDSLGLVKFSFPPRADEFISVDMKGSKKYFQVIVVHHATSPEPAVEIYAVETKATWELKKPRTIGFGS